MYFTVQLEKLFLNLKNRFSANQFACFIAAMIAGLVAHGYALFNRISYHDNAACLFSLGGTYGSGRWMLGFIYDLQMMTTKLFAVPVFNGLLSLIFIALAAMLVVEMFEVRSKVWSVFIGIIMVVYPVVTSIFSFMFTAWEYFLALLLAVVSAKVLIESWDAEAMCDAGKAGKAAQIKSFVLSAILLSMSLGLYQAFFAVTIGLFLTAMFMDVISDRITTVKDYVLRGILALCQLVAGLGIWAVMRKVTMAIKGIEAVEYKGMSDGYSLAKFPARVAEAYKAFFGFRQAGINATLYLRAFTALVILVTVIQIVYAIIVAKQHMVVKLVSVIGLVLLPLAMNVVYILSTSEDYAVDSLMVYGNIFVFILPVLLIEWMENAMSSAGSLTGKLMIPATWVQIISLLVLTLGYTYMDNAAYMKAEIAVEQATAYFTELVANIKSTEGFEDDMEIIFVGWNFIEDGTNAKVDSEDQLEAIQIDKFPRFEEIITYGGSRYFLQEHLGFGNDQLIEDDGTVAAEPAVKAMPTYPNDGAIAVVDGRVIVKLGENGR